jgi:hypothetical protein
MKITEIINEDWNKVNKQDKTDGLSQKAVNAYRRENPGSKLKTAVTTKPSKLKPGSKAAKRRKSFCARMSGNKGPMKKPNGKPTPKALALRRWNCESIEEMAQMIIEGEQMIAEIKKGQKDSNGFTKCWPGKHAEGTKKGKNGKPVRNCVPNESVAESADQVKKVFKDKAGRPVGEIGIDPESSPGNGEWYVHHYATGYSVVGFDSAAEAKRELMYVHKHPDSVEGHESTQGVAEEWSQKYKSSINCASPKGFSQKAHCASKKK